MNTQPRHTGALSALLIFAFGSFGTTQTAESLKSIEDQYAAAFELYVEQGHLAKVADLDGKYLVALERALKTATNEQQPSLRAEIERVRAKQELPVKDNDVELPLAKFRKAYREALGKLNEARKDAAEPILKRFDEALAKHQAALTDAGKQEEATAVLAYRKVGVAAKLLGSGRVRALEGGSGGGVDTGNQPKPGAGFDEQQHRLGARIPVIMKNRCTDAERLRMLHVAGGTEKVEEAVKKSLAWLTSKQNQDGSWGTTYKPAMTGLALLCYLGHCESTQSGEYGHSIFEGIIYLIEQASKNQGWIGSNLQSPSWAYEHAIATYALAEALCYSRTLEFPLPDLETTVQKAAQVIIQGQTTQGCWDYNYANKGRNDLSLGGWQIQALKAAQISSVNLEGLDTCLRKTSEYLEKIAYLSDGKFAYAGTGSTPAMTAVGALCLQNLDKGESKAVKAAVELMLDGLKLRAKPNLKVPDGDITPVYAMRYNDPNSDLYAWYYMVQVMRNVGGVEWELTNKAILEEILTAQNPDGSFKPENPAKGPSAHFKVVNNPVLLQTLNTLSLEVYYRFDPVSFSHRR